MTSAATFARGALLVAGALLVSACAGDKVWMRSGATSSDAEIDEMNCATEAENPGISVNVGAGAGVPSDRFSNRFACLRSKGYKLRPLTAEESAKLKSLSGVEREVYRAELLRKNGLTPPVADPVGPAPANAVIAPAPAR